MTKQTKAQRLADFLKGVNFLSDLQSGLSPITGDAIAAELRRMDANEEALVGALRQITGVYGAVRQTLSEKYPEDGWTLGTMTLDMARALITRIEAERKEK